MGKLIFVGGGVRSGKSSFAQSLALERGERRAYIATATADDDEMRQRIERHRRERGVAFETIEAPVELAAAIERANGGGAEVIVIDCLTLWMSNLLGRDEDLDDVLARVERVLASVRGGAATVVAVSNEVGMGIVPVSALGRAFRDVAGFVHQRVGAAADEVYWAVLGTILRVRPSALEVR